MKNFSGDSFFEKKHQWHIYIFLLFLSIVFVYFFSYSTSPYYQYYYGGDSAQFQTIGKSWANGIIPYKELFDHKGPIIFFINMLGYMLTGNSSGLMMIQMLFMFITVIYLYKLSQLAVKRVSYGMITVIISLILFSIIYGGGNFTEEYCLPFITISTYLQTSYLLNQTNISSFQNHKANYAFFYGVAFSICLLTRVTNAITICAGVAVIGLGLFISKKYEILKANMIGFILGSTLVLLPFVVYFVMMGAVDEFIYGMLGYNFEYKKSMNSWVINSTFNQWKQFIKAYFISYSVLITAFLSFKRGKRCFVIYCVLCACLELYLFFSGALFTQYVMITLPQVVMLINEILLLKKDEDIVANFYQIILMICIISQCYFSVNSIIPQAENMHYKYGNFNAVGYEQLLEQVPRNELDRFVAYGDNDFKELYLLHDITPNCKYFVIQEWHASFSEYVRNDIYNIFESKEYKWILTSGATSNIQSILDSKYYMIDENNKYRLYCKKT